MYVVFGCQEKGSEHRSVSMLCLVRKKVKENHRKGVSAFQLMFCGGKVVEVSVCVVFGWQESERK